LYELWKSKPQELQIKGIDGEEFKNIPLVTQNGRPLFELAHISKYGVSNNSPNWTTLTFQKQDGSELIEFGLNKKGELEITQTTPYQSTITNFHRETGNIKVRIEQPKNGNQTVTYYNKSGQWSLLKNLLRGGTFIVPQ